MKNKELRRGNLVSHKSQIKTVDCISPGYVILLEDRPDNESFGEWISLDDIEFISLIEYWILKFGFDSVFDFKIHNEDGDVFYYAEKLKHVHQLQNLYHSLKGEELTIK